MKGLMLGNEAVARGLYETGVRVVSSYPGTPSTEITEYACKYEEIYCEWAPNEKVACEVALGASIGGARAFCAMKHVGMNVAADPLFTASYTGVNAGLVIAVADDPGMHSSQNEQDSRHYAKSAKVPMLEPADSEECKRYTKLAYELSEQFDTPVLLRLSTRVSHSQSIIETEDRQELDLKEYKKDPTKYVMMPAYAKPKHVVVEERTKKLIEYAETADINTVEYNSLKVGVITAGIAYQYAKEALGDSASYLKLGMIHPLPVKLIKEFACKVDTLYIIEELDDVIETHCRKLGLEVIGKELFTYIGEYSQSLIREKMLGEKTSIQSFGEAVPMRPPVMCPGCPHRGLFYALNRLGVTVFGDIGCYTLGAAPPLAAMDTTICMGASISGLHGFNKARGEQSARNSVAVIGDSTFMHSGVTGLIDIAYNQGVSTILILDNSITGMTGHQQNPTTGFTIKGDPTARISIEKLCEAVGISRVRITDPNDVKNTLAIIKEELAVEEPSVIIARRPCALLKNVKHDKPLAINREKCRACRACFKIGCPSIRMQDGKASIDTTLCVGCGLCAGLCAFGAIGSEKEEQA
ncbi:indolepyruvate ferredoxin oxidoreductase subunit alpha [Acetanaerobacterium elongatum]|uniref:Indolepyruvate oxidoreductase subunit IorA n=1 Tax=Acetanaerobacterium elongatum TaxID=258515 RepID=A0A1G9WVC3_9FIRM|nr:indolepyruvate ferredoxin oxidoreductase subunit alpha [Acetanaerobacterium elongatum]SDM88482.1 indolepyruvate ferredoxin oxidoreductase alpha subunit [Acetanaerobacterium elongatum]